MMRWLKAEVARAPTAYALLLVVLVAFGAYANSMEGGFHFDDGHHIVKNPFVHDLAYAPEYFHRPDLFSAVPGHAMYRPLVMLSFALNYHWGGYQPLVWRLTAVALHALCAVGVFLTVRLLVLRFLQRPPLEASFGALVAALFLALHPVFTEAVNYASARSSLLATGLAAWAFFLHLRGESARSRPVRLALYLASLLALAAALLAKEIVVVFPALLLWAAVLQRRGYLAVVPSLAVVLLYLWVRQTLLGEAVIDFERRAASVATAEPGSGGARPVLWNLFTQARVIGAYLLIFAWPQGLCVERHVRVSQTPFELGVILGALLIAGLLWAAWRLRRSRPLVSLGLVWFLVSLAPTSSVIPLNQVMNERRLYLPGVGLALAAGGLAVAATRARRIWVPSALAVALVLGAVTLDRNRDWRASLHLWRSATEVSPKSHAAWNGLCGELTARGDFDGAFEALRRARELEPDYWPAIFNLGWLYLHRGGDAPKKSDLEQAELWFEDALSRHPESERARWNLAETHARMGRIEQAESEFRAMAGLNRRMFEMTRYPLARMALDRGDYEGAADYYRQVLDLGTDPVGAHLGFARIARERGDKRGADRAARQAIEARPHSWEPYLFLARLHRGTVFAARYLIEAERRGCRVSPARRAEILGAGQPSSS